MTQVVCKWTVPGSAERDVVTLCQSHEARLLPQRDSATVLSCGKFREAAIADQLIGRVN